MEKSSDVIIQEKNKIIEVLKTHAYEPGIHHNVIYSVELVEDQRTLRCPSLKYPSVSGKLFRNHLSVQDEEIEEVLKKPTVYGALIEGAVPHWGLNLNELTDPELLMKLLVKEKGMYE
jgi:hypothetical protein